ncbi:DUF1990 family protein [Amycolatopsis viridis]|uniref:Uncharacterized protein (UPF0548 family) n=1 Tax=Amycolatopsis viridis TaxID=185678 RepID=A0ABX0SV01_9PSEU|nr:DUF1990 domain-containing protein [Amycolatopsis viridis]NIH80445.1 uncharacterized protein (UPF0548 family) [Amycolatopsis viridis]
MPPEFTYAEVGGTRGALPAGYRHLRRHRVLGQGRDRFEEAAAALLHWEVQKRAGLRVDTAADTVTEGAVAHLRLGPRPLRMTAPVRVVYVLDEDRRRGFGYGTLPGHPESGEEAFVVELGLAGTVTFRITAFSRPASLLTRLAGPVAHLAEGVMTNRYLQAL